MNFNLSNVARVLFCLPFYVFGFIHYTSADMLQHIVPSYMPFGGLFWVYASGTSLILTATGILIKKWDRLAALCLAPTIYAFGLMVHLPALLDGNPNGKSNLLKDFLIGAACLLYAASAEKSR
ncbi:MAG: hypothetical protein ACKVOR_08510 [Flavobacteriales bacterium]